MAPITKRMVLKAAKSHGVKEIDQTKAKAVAQHLRALERLATGFAREWQNYVPTRGDLQTLSVSGMRAIDKARAVNVPDRDVRDELNALAVLLDKVEPRRAAAYGREIARRAAELRDYVLHYA